MSSLPLIKERQEFQQWILKHLVEQNHFLKRSNHHYDPLTSFDKELLWEFLSSTQPKKLEKLSSSYGPNYKECIINHINDQIVTGKKTTIDILKNGLFFKNGVTLMFFYPKPMSGLNPEALTNFTKNIFSVIEEVTYKNQDRIDLVLFVNGIAIFALELKTSHGDNSYRKAITQFKETRDSNSRLLKHKVGVLCVFALDFNDIFFCTKLDGTNSEFLTFNKGHEGSTKNPTVEDDYPVSYLWREIFTKNNISLLIDRFIYLKEHKSLRGKSKIVFPRYHQFRCVLNVVNDISKYHTSKNYLIQHSAGSGKTLTISWLCQMLSSLHTREHQCMFDKILIVTDRRVVDKQLQISIKTLEKQAGAVKYLDETCTSKDLSNSIYGGERIIISTMQKFLSIAENFQHKPDQKDRRYAVIIDEGHSSNHGENVKCIKTVLTNADYANPYERELALMGKQDNITFIAFTATPDEQTCDIFGTPNAEGKKQCFDLYSMQQALEENFIVNVCENYLPYSVMQKISKKTEEDPEVKSALAKRELKKLRISDPTTIYEKLKIMVDHFDRECQRRFSYDPKAMIVANDRRSAVTYLRQFYKLMKDNFGMYHEDYRALIAFSGTITEDGDDVNEFSDYTKEKMTEADLNNAYAINKKARITESNLTDFFNSKEYQFLIVAEKYQTGFDQPKLTAMYIDTKIANISAVQTLSRLNRIIPGAKKHTFVLDFQDNLYNIKEAFKTYCGYTVLEASMSDYDIDELSKKIEHFDFYSLDDLQVIVDAFNNRGDESKCRKAKERTDQLLLKLDQLERHQKDEIKNSLRKLIRMYNKYTVIEKVFREKTTLTYKYAWYLLHEWKYDKHEDDHFSIAGDVSIELTGINPKDAPSINISGLDKSAELSHKDLKCIEIIADQKKRLSEIIEDVNKQMTIHDYEDWGITKEQKTQIDKYLIRSIDKESAYETMQNNSKANHLMLCMQKIIDMSLEEYAENPEINKEICNEQNPYIKSYVTKIINLLYDQKATGKMV